MIFRWLIRLIWCIKAVLQILHLYGFSPVCILIWDMCAIFWESFLSMSTLIWFFTSMRPHEFYKLFVSLNSSITMATLIWFLTSVECPHMFIRLPICEKSLSQWLHWCGLFPVCIICLNMSRHPQRRDHFKVHRYGLSPVWARRWIIWLVWYV